MGCEDSSLLVDLLRESDVVTSGTATVTLSEKDGSGITGTAIFTESSIIVGDESTPLTEFDVEIQNAVPDRKYAAYIYTGTSCEAPGNILPGGDGILAYSFTADENGTGKRGNIIDLTISEIIGKVVVIHEQVGSGDLVDGTQVSCGVITSSE